MLRYSPCPPRSSRPSSVALKFARSAGIVPVRPLVGAGKASWPEVFWLMTNEVRSERSAIVGGMDPVRRLFVNELCG